MEGLIKVNHYWPVRGSPTTSVQSCGVSSTILSSVFSIIGGTARLLIHNRLWNQGQVDRFQAKQYWGRTRLLSHPIMPPAPAAPQWVVPMPY